MKLSGVGVFNNKKADLAFKLLLFKDLTKVLIRNKTDLYQLKIKFYQRSTSLWGKRN